MVMEATVVKETLTLYVCEVCGREYLSRSIAEQCEERDRVRIPSCEAT